MNIAKKHLQNQMHVKTARRKRQVQDPNNALDDETDAPRVLPPPPLLLINEKETEEETVIKKCRVGSFQSIVKVFEIVKLMQEIGDSSLVNFLKAQEWTVREANNS